MRTLMWFAIGFSAACGLGTWVLSKVWFIPLTLLCTLLFAIGKIKQGSRMAGILGTCGLGCAVGLIWFLFFQTIHFYPITGLEGITQELSVTAADYSYDTGYGTGVDGTTEIEGKLCGVRVYLDGDLNICPGDSINAVFRLKSTLPYGEETATYHAGNGTYLLAYQKGAVEIARAENTPWRYYPAVLSHRIEGILKESFSEFSFPFAKALLLGDSYDLSYEQDTALKVSGIRHVVAVSGLHVSLLFGLVGILTLHKNWITAFLGFPVLFLFAAMAGFTPSVTRACIMSAMMLISQLVAREYDGATALAAAVLVMLVKNPLAIASVSLQLSVTSIAGIHIFSQSIYAWLLDLMGNPKAKTTKGKFLRWFASSLAVTLGAMSLTTPLTAWYFGMISLIGIIVNLMTLWLVSLVFYGLACTCFLALVWKGGALVLAKAVEVGIRLVLVIAQRLSDFPVAAVYTRSIYVVLWLVFVYGLLTVFLLQKKRRPAELICGCVISLCVCLCASWLEPLPLDFQMTVLDVGQGQSILFQSDGQHWLVDCGGESDTQTSDIVSETLLSRGINQLNGVILTHYDRDHAGALENLLARIPVQRLILPEAEEIPYVHNGINVIEAPSAVEFGQTTIRLYPSAVPEYPNENSMCVLFEAQNCAILITGDRSSLGERILLRENVLPDVDVLIAGHHGAGDSTGEVLLGAVKPETVIISVGENNPYGHPSAALLRRLEAFGCDVYRTDLHGEILYRR